ncbi:hypothetical protein M427DRAFT_119369 [Gonapodya prolifera JEL478]|uniref:FK506-binding protein n=1 Tax=Gonapodya prolifera (strain JEL478) TaxID=1344416 RepID=A0A139AVS2_GONPJ|nr:hypothetical protein M427DRAFT_119369 [Gonapodya prolifera JEL478]|eukprot:KXS20830.1 hypothetical protein M427DRAFT_119369 [Gonapodya prolifera JEL478]
MSFWGLKVVPGKSYSQTVEVPFRVTMAALGPGGDAGQSSLFVSVDDNEFVLCTLDTAKPQQQPLTVQFGEGENISFKALGPNPIYLTGAYLPDLAMEGFEDDEDDEEIDSDEAEGLEDDDEDMEEASDEEEDADMEAAIAAAIAGKKAAKANATKAAPAKKNEKPEKAAPATQPASAKRTLEAEGDDSAPAKKAKAESGAATSPAKDQKKQQPQKQHVKKEEAKKEEAAPKEEGKKEALQGTPKAPKAKVLPSGLAIEDVVVGDGPRAKSGKSVAVRYIGRLTSGKVFDSNTNGKPFKFTLSKGQVIKGWDLGVQGMNVGGTRKLTIPPNLAYGAKGAPPDIPPNSTLVFEVKLLEVGK